MAMYSQLILQRDPKVKTQIDKSRRERNLTKYIY